MKIGIAYLMTKTIMILAIVAAFVAGSKLFDVQDYTETTHYIEYIPTNSGDSIQYKLEFSTDGVLWHPEPDEVVASGVGTVIPKTRTFVSLAASIQFVPVLSMPVADNFMRILVKETVASTFGVVTWRSRATKLK